ncbi:MULTISPECIES: GlxA family transcriptional regulator [unclassified Saccharibacter]|uniref:GlxA family transcriptional regulator n=1 Tax=unclassified Saccharibacter TaxID=2648722 RepID=UPI00132A01A3|nr:MULTISPECIES: helix-turn-helix domain-containing protein [unclassified Saccharibacter]MXV35265.1 helix-turn-helix domain-containing protein [Saccharibacter sp. EH611]MXV57887.1 helix-turn-helix domain-containing protein [Saccharibacter sp. EH70]MXV65199.1 helix-turn-helix domain-containing protein [Saccharibacter sp. EH60]
MTSHLKMASIATKITIIHYETAQSAAIYGLQDLFSVALIAHKHSSRRPNLLSQICYEDSLPTLEPHLRHIIIIPPSLEGIPDPKRHSALLQKLTSWYQQGAFITAACAGTFLVAATKLLDGQKATTHWSYKEKLTQQFPAVTADVQQVLIDNGRIITASGLMAWVELGLHLIGRIFGEEARERTAHFMFVTPTHEQYRPSIAEYPSINHSDKFILKAQEWLEKADGTSVTVSSFADASGLTQRTFLRRFKRATGMTPKDYLLHYIMNKSKHDIATTCKSITQIAWDAGYSELGAFRRAFKRATGFSPAVYRHRSKLS